MILYLVVSKRWIISIFKGRHFKKEIILWAVRWYCKYGISYRDLESMAAEGGLSIDHATLNRWVIRYDTLQF